MWIWVILGLAAFGFAYVQLAPSDPARWHREIKGTAAMDMPGGALRIVLADLAALDRLARAQGAKVLAGSVEEGRITYVTRTRICGFPDYTTAEQRGAALAIYGRLRFGKSDMGVNRRRIERWIAQL